MTKNNVTQIQLGGGKVMNLKYDNALAKLTEINTATINAAIVAYWSHVDGKTIYLTLGDYLDAIGERLGASKSSIVQTALAFHAGRKSPYQSE